MRCGVQYRDKAFTPVAGGTVDVAVRWVLEDGSASGEVTVNVANLSLSPGALFATVQSSVATQVSAITGVSVTTSEVVFAGGPPGVGVQRVIASGSTSIAALTTATITTQTRNATERVTALAFVAENDANFGWSNVEDGLTGITWWFERTANANEFILQARNNHLTLSRTLEWVILGIVP